MKNSTTVTLTLRVPVTHQDIELAYGEEPLADAIAELVESLVRDALDSLTERHDVVTSYSLAVKSVQ